MRLLPSAVAVCIALAVAATSSAAQSWPAGTPPAAALRVAPHWSAVAGFVGASGYGGALGRRDILGPLGGGLSLGAWPAGDRAAGVHARLRLWTTVHASTVNQRYIEVSRQWNGRRPPDSTSSRSLPWCVMGGEQLWPAGTGPTLDLGAGVARATDGFLVPMLRLAVGVAWGRA